MVDKRRARTCPLSSPRDRARTRKRRVAWGAGTRKRTNTWEGRGRRRKKKGGGSFPCFRSTVGSTKEIKNHCWGRQSSSWRGQGRRCKGGNGVSKEGWALAARLLLLKKKKRRVGIWVVSRVVVNHAKGKKESASKKKGVKPARGAHNTHRPLDP